MAATARNGVVTFGLALAMPLSWAMSLAEAFDAARSYDPQYRGESFALTSAQQAVPFARSSLLPLVSLNVSNADVSGSREFSNVSNQNVTTHLDYSSPQTSLSLRQPIFNYEAMSRYKQAQSQVEGAEAQFRAKGLELVDRLTGAYMQTLLARTALNLAQTEVISLQAQSARAEQRQLRGEGTRIEEAQARASLDQARFRVIDGQDQVDVAASKLRRLTGIDTNWLAGAPLEYRPGPLQPKLLQAWLDQANEQSPVLEARRQQVEVARANVQRNVAGHLPRLDFVASLSKNRNETISNLNQSSALKSVGVQLSVPLYSGGGVQASVVQARADLARAEQELQAERENIELEVQRLYLAVHNGVARFDALTRVVQSSEITLQGITRAQDAGLATIADVLDAQTKLFSANRDLVQARYEYLASRARLMSQVGSPMQRVIDDLGQILSVKTDIQKSAAP